MSSYKGTVQNNTEIQSFEGGIVKAITKNAGIRNTLRTGKPIGDTDSDRTLLTNVINYITYKSNNGLILDKWSDKNVGTTMPFFDSLINEGGWNDALIQSMNTNAQDPSGKFYVNNAVAVHQHLLGVQGNNFCPEASIIDPQPLCSQITNAMEYGYEWGVMDVTIHDGTTFKPNNQSKIGATIIYRIRVDPIINASGRPPKEMWISAYLQIGDNVLINLKWSDLPVEVQWPGGFNEGIHVDLTIPSTQGMFTAKQTLIELMTFIGNLPQNTGVQTCALPICILW